jgi:BirA family transcriptional regulator, biotin operon repressor / biotin---[acetyl-CoA-carboxylase] ligase
MKHFHYAELPSTNDTAKELLRSEFLPMLAVTAEVQTSGRGRNGKVWVGEAGANLYCSVAVRHSTQHTMLDLVTYQAIGCLAAKAAIQEVSNHAGFAPELLLKYPNDIYISYLVNTFHRKRRKICGVLVEHEFLGNECIASVIGVGINVRQSVFPSDLHEKATSLLLAGVDVSSENICAALLRYVELFLKQRSEGLFEAWRNELGIHNALVSIQGEQGLWRVVSLQEDGRLLVSHADTHDQRLVDNGDSIVRTDWL